MGNYRQSRNYENLQRAIFAGVGEFGIPDIAPVHLAGEPLFIGFNYARSCEEPEQHGIHFFVDDYQFVRLWQRPDAYLQMLRKFQCVCTPDFSTYTDFPKAVQIFNHYRKHWLGAYWQLHGITVIPTISWSDESSFDWCFDGEPVGGVTAVSSVGTQMSKTASELFRKGYSEMMRRLQPELVIFYGAVPDGLETGNILHVQAFQNRLHQLSKQREAQSNGR